MKKEIMSEPKTMPCLRCRGTGVMATERLMCLGHSGFVPKNVRDVKCTICDGTGVIDAPELKTEPGYIPPTR